MHICLVASELLGAHKNGGIGTATSHLACWITRCGHDVRIVYTGLNPIDSNHPWIRRLRNHGIDVTHIDIGKSPVYPTYLRESCAVFEYLRFTAYDLIIFQDWNGGAFSSVQAKRAGIAFQQARLAVVAHGPTEWLLEANRHPVKARITLAQIHMEREVMSGVDAVICPSRYMRDWLAQAGYRTDHACTIPLYLWSDPETDLRLQRDQPIDNVTTLAFFGRLEERKGIDLFVRALLDDCLAFRNFRVIFVGKEATLSEASIRAFIKQQRPWLLPRLTFEKSLDSEEAQSLLVAENCLAVIPSLSDNAPCVVSECLRHGIPFVAAATGGIPELIDERDRKRALTRPCPNELARRLADILDQPFLPIGPAYREADIAERWRIWLDNQVPNPLAASSSVMEIETSGYINGVPQEASYAVVLTHYERPELVNIALQAFALQTDKNFELILVDDGSKSDAARSNLDAIESKAWPFRLKILRCTNAYLGAARNAGIRATSATSIVFMDDDNIAFPNLIETFATAQRRTGADIITCQMSIFREASGEPDLSLLADGERWGFTGGPAELGLSVNCFGDATGIYQRSVFDRIGYFHEWRGIGHEDWHFHARAALAGLRHISLPVPLYWYRRTQTGMLLTTDMYENNRIIWDVYKTVLPQPLKHLADLAIKNSFTSDEPIFD